MKITKAIEHWHQIVENKDSSQLNGLIAENAAFHSPIVHTPQKGKALTVMYLTAAIHVFSRNKFIYVRQMLNDKQAFLEFETVIDGVVINGVDIIECDENSKITQFKVMIRPLQGLNKMHSEMMKLLEKQKSLAN